jgi:hypothetical protein
VQITPPGFHIIYLPYADDFRKVKYEDLPRGNVYSFTVTVARLVYVLYSRHPLSPLFIQIRYKYLYQCSALVRERISGALIAHPSPMGEV